MKLSPKHITGLKVIIHLVSLSFAALLILQTLSGNLGADPVQGISHFTGKAALNTLMVTLLISPVAKYFRQGGLMKIRRLTGLYSFFWAALHLLGYLALDLNFNWSLLAVEIASRPYLTLGAISWLILLALAVTSTQNMQRRLGFRWQKLHNLVYLALLLSPIHYYWSVKSGITEPALYILVSLILLGLRYKTFKRWFSGFSGPNRAASSKL
ncbi:Membrane protein YedZ [Photobacterium marinum]|uniref:Protein-methionine-sulfoxide reductase heme-binding subunit MsrQ n=1 Tax=Photobacterium marinum TaxID=1056511 RepID=L8J814_9GAMM|nr:protein-methionine-sulfoxide reductase heme-binding subunit MsrQ [Photobacterium marinum]ELR64303.1 Membrane protein YedZ [Photobacterium marinum]